MKVISKQLRDSARGEDCSLRLDGCMNNTETTVLCHAPYTGMRGIGMKVPDFLAVYGCHHCHDIIDRRKKGDWSPEDIIRALAETQMKFLEKGLISIKGVKP